MPTAMREKCKEPRYKITMKMPDSSKDSFMIAMMSD
jgi:hypothetical protein